MKEICRKSFSFLLTLCMLLTLMPTGAATEIGGAYEEGESYFDTESEADAESVAETESVTEDESETETESVAENVETDDIASSAYMAAAEIEPNDAETDTEAEKTDVAESASETPKKAEPQENPNKKAKMSSNPLRDAQREYLQIPENSKAQRVAESGEDLFNELHSFFRTAQGAEGIVHFGAGVRERTLTVRIPDNDDADGDRMFLLGLLGTDTPNVRSIYYDGESSTIYNPGRVEVHQSSAGGALVSGFYRNASNTVVLIDANHTKNQQRGIVLKGVYFASSGKSASDLYKNGSYKTSSTYYVAAKNGQVSLKLNESFHKTLTNSGVISGREGSRATIRIYPVYQQKTVEIHFENADRNDANASEKGKYDASHLASHIDNIVQASGKSGSGVSKEKYKGWLDYYKMNVPKNSVIRVKAVPAANRTVNGVVWWAFGSNAMNRVYYERGQKIADPLYASGRTLAETDYTMADVIASQNLCIKPNTGNQTLYVGYSPRSLNWAKNAFGNSLQGAIVDVTDGTPKAIRYGVNASNADGALTRDALLGGQYAMLVNAPEGYYTSWADMTGDNDYDGSL